MPLTVARSMIGIEICFTNERNHSMLLNLRKPIERVLTICKVEVIV